MCGIAGVVSELPVERSRLQRALSALSTRGPDGSGSWWNEDGTVGLGHRRLAINGRDEGAQPMVESASAGVVNGEFYGLPSRYDGISDSRALPDLVAEQGWEGALKGLRGEFSLLHYDRPTDTLYVARDRFGVKPLFWARRGREIWFASKASALWAAGVDAGWCRESFLQAAAGQYPPAGRSLFEGIHTVRPGHFLRVKTGRVGETRYWAPPKASPLACRDPVGAFKETLQESVTLRLRRGHQNAVLLSGGVDSAAVCALASRSGERVKAYTVDFPEAAGSSFSEGALARKQAAYSQLECEVIPLTRADILSSLPTTVKQLEGLVVNGHAVGKWMLARAVSEDRTKVLLSGEGSDELLYGYRHFKPYFGGTGTIEDPAGLGILVSSQVGSPLEQDVPHFFHSKYHLGARILSLMGADVDQSQVFRGRLEDAGTGSPREIARSAWLTSALQGYILEVLGDGAEMAHSVEGRPPFLDHHLWEMVSKLPTKCLDGEKSLLRESMKGLVIEEIRNKAKHPFMAPSLGIKLVDLLIEKVGSVNHSMVRRRSALSKLRLLQEMAPRERQEWEPALMWLLSSYYLQELWSEPGV